MLRNTAQLLLKRPKGPRGGRPRLGRLQQHHMQMQTTRKSEQHKLTPGFHKYRWINADVDKHDIWRTVKDEDALTLYRQTRGGQPLTQSQLNLPPMPLYYWQNFSYHFHADMDHWIRTVTTLQDHRKRAHNEEGSHDYDSGSSSGVFYGGGREKFRRTCHLLKVEELKKQRKSKIENDVIDKKDGEDDWEDISEEGGENKQVVKTKSDPNVYKAQTPRQLIEETVKLCGPSVFPFHTKLKRLSKYKQYKQWSVKTFGRFTTRAFTFRAMRNAILVGQKPGRAGEFPIVYANEIMKASQGLGKAYEQKVRFHQIAVRERHRLRTKW